jgi:hypothetical protein
MMPFREKIRLASEQDTSRREAILPAKQLFLTLLPRVGLLAGVHYGCNDWRIASHLEDNEIVEAMENDAADLFLRLVCFQSRKAARTLLDLFPCFGKCFDKLIAQFRADATQPLRRLGGVIRRAKLQSRPLQVVRLARATASRMRARASSPSTRMASPRSMAADRSCNIRNHSA